MDTRRGTRRTIVLAVVLAALATGQSGCLFSSTETFSVALGDLDLANRSMARLEVDLSTNGTYQDNETKIKRVDRVGFITAIVNPGIASGNVSLWFSEDASLDSRIAVEENATPLIRGLHVPARTLDDYRREISYRESTELIEDADAFRRAIEAGAFSLYLTGDGSFPIRFDDLILVVTFTVGL